MKICYIVLVYNELFYTFKTFESIKMQTQEKYEFDIICIDNNSDYDIANKLKSYCEENRIRYIFHNVNDGYTGGNNYAWKIVKEEGYDYVFIANNDIEIFNTATTEKIIEIFQSNPKIALVGTHLVDKDGNAIKYSSLHKTIMKMEKINDYYSNDFITVPTVVGCFFCIRTSIISNDLFNTSFYMYSEEQNLEYELMLKGNYIGVLKDTNYIIKHYGGFFDFRTASDWKIYLNIRNQILTLRNFKHIYRKILYIIMYILLVVKLFITYKKTVIIKAFLKGIFLSSKSDEIIYNDAVSSIAK